ncbi:GTP pyrophosphokinase [Actinoallomurus sp. CA-150999]|uniref:GTP pyrophosphokinase n=1 Tax=Actinoallomurus sp. CA-150999 TaxID=3239887 RepID=UPI003D8E6990
MRVIVTDPADGEGVFEVANEASMDPENLGSDTFGFEGERSRHAEDWGEKYRLARGQYESFKLRLEALITDLIRRSEVDIIQLDTRTKEVASFVEKVQRKGQRYSNPLDDMTDLVGVRVITHYVEDVALIGKLIEREFRIDAENSINKSHLLDPDRFGYVSVHFVASISEAREDLPEWKPYKGIRFEIQVRTALQHAWAAVNHKLDYKSSREIPSELRRRLFRLSALFELADEQLSGIRRESSRISSEYAAGIQGGNFDLPLNKLSLDAYLKYHPTVAAARAAMESSGHLLSDESALSDEQRELVRHRLLIALRAVSIDSLYGFDSFIREELPLSLKAVSSERRESSKAGISAAFEVRLSSRLFVARGVAKEAFRKVFSEDSWDKYELDREKYLELVEAVRG